MDGSLHRAPGASREHHIDEEEGEFFKIARKIFDRETLAKMGTAFTAEKTKLASVIN